MLKVRLVGFEKVLTMLSIRPTKMLDAMDKEMLHVASDIRVAAKGFVAKDTRRLMKSIRIKKYKHGLYAILAGGPGTGVDYAVPQEFGTSKHPGTPYMRPALAKYRPTIIPRILKAIQGAK